MPQKRKAFDLIGLGPFAPWLLLALLFYVLRRLQVWLHQHIFKVGWLITNQYQTTTILYYAFFLPGILLNQVTVWMVAGFLNVRAARSIAWPKKQEIGELKLDFVQLSKSVDSFRLAIISTAPLVVGLVVTWSIANNILNVPAFLSAMGENSSLGNVASAAGTFTTAPDFWLWVYIAFTISNTMMPNFKNLRGWRILIAFAVIFIIVLYAVGAGNQVVMNNLNGPVTDSVNALSSIFAIIIGLDIFMVAVLGTLEAIIERATGDSATFQNGKMITMRRSEMLAQRAQALVPQPKTTRPTAAPAGPPSVYKLLFPIPGPPGKEMVTHDEGIIITPDPNMALPAPSQPPGRSIPAVIAGSVTEKLPDTTEPRPSVSPSPNQPPRPVTPTTSQPFGSSVTATPTRPGSPSQPKSPGVMQPTPPRTAAPTGSSSSGVMSPTPPRPPASLGSTSPAAAQPTPPRPSLASPHSPGAAPFSAPSARPPLPVSKSPFGDEMDEDDDEEDEDDVNYEDFEDPA